MAGTFTHWMVVEEAISKLPKELPYDKKLNLLNLQKPFVLLGAVSPDLPYLTDPVIESIIKTHSWADRMHYQFTGLFVRNGMENLIHRKEEDFNLCYAWLFGYASHVITDVIIHPVVNAIVGPYRFNATEHRDCEMTQDSLLFSLWQKEDITNTEYHHTLLDASDRPNKESALNARSIKKCVRDFWVETLRDTYPMASGKFGDIKPNNWYADYVEGIGMSKNPSPVFRPLGEKIKVVYLSEKDLNSKEKVKQKQRYFDNVSIPGGASQGFLSVFRKAASHVHSVWLRMEEDIHKKDFSRSMEYLKNWDLDQGLDMDNADLWRS